MLGLLLMRHEGLVELQGFFIRGEVKNAFPMFFKKLPRVLKADALCPGHWKRQKIEEAYQNSGDLEPLPGCVEGHDDSQVKQLGIGRKMVWDVIRVGVLINNYDLRVKLF